MVCVLALASLPSVAVAAPACGCPDLKAIQYRIKEIQAIIKNYEAEIARIGTDQPFTYDDYHKFETDTQKPMLNAMKLANPGSPSTFGAKTHSTTCISSFPSGASRCLRAALEKHEAYHAGICSLKKGKLNTTLFTDYREGASLAVAYEEEIVASRVELDALDAAFEALPDACKPTSWFLRFHVAITGGGTTSISTFSSITYRVKHEYSGAVELIDKGRTARTPDLGYTPEQIRAMTMQQRIQMAKDLNKATTYVRTWMYLLPAPIDVEIDDLFTQVTHALGEGGTYRDTTMTQTWKAKVADEVRTAFSLELDEATRSYNIRIPIELTGSAKTLKKEETTESHWTAPGKALAPEAPTTVSEMMRPASMDNPSAASILVGRVIAHDKPQPFAPKLDILSFDSGNLLMDESSTFMSNIRDVRKRVHIHVTYTLSKRPIN